jgi:DNA-binding GntR family transcriptional regulator
MATDKPRKAKRNNREKVLADLREKIADGLLPQGGKLIEQDLAHEFGVSRSMIREVLADLERQGLVAKQPKKGTLIRRVDSESLLEIMEIREVLEGLAARLAAQKSRPSDWLDLEKEFGEPFDQIVENSDFEKYLDLITAFRNRMVEAAQNEELAKLVNSLYATIRIIQRRIVILPGRIQQAIGEHREVLKAIMEGDPDRAERVKRLNLQSAREYLTKYKKWVL